MTIKKTLGGDRLGSGNKMQVELHNYERSTHDLGYIWKSSMAPGTLVPFINELALPGDTFDIDLNADVKTLPTVGPLFGSFKMQMDVFVCPIRLYQAVLHNNKLGVGMDMSTVLLPRIGFVDIKGLDFASSVPLEFQQINQSSILAYLGIRGLGWGDIEAGNVVTRDYNGVPYFAYWDIYKNYYANKQEEIGAVIHTENAGEYEVIQVVIYERASLTSPWDAGTVYTEANWMDADETPLDGLHKVSITATYGSFNTEIAGDQVGNNILFPVNQEGERYGRPLGTIYEGILTGDGSTQLFSTLQIAQTDNIIVDGSSWFGFSRTQPTEQEVRVHTFPLENIDGMREQILQTHQSDAYTVLTGDDFEPFSLPLGKYTNNWPYAQFSQEGLALKTYQSDIFNNWLSTEWIDGTNGINQITAIDTSDGQFTIDTLQLSKKVYDMLNRIAVSGGSYGDWMEAVYGNKPYGVIETPLYMGGLSKEVIFQQVVSTAATDGDPLGSLAGRGGLSGKHKGGHIHIRVDEPSYIIGLVSLTPRIDYSQGNDWKATELHSMDDLHKPALDEIGFQELITKQMAFWDGKYWEKLSAGKQPAWLNYMTSFNKNYGNFADPRKEMFMTLNRRYEADLVTGRIKDLTTYIDPAKFNYMFSQTSRDSQNFWVQIAVDIEARRKMSAKLMPNL